VVVLVKNEPVGFSTLSVLKPEGTTAMPTQYLSRTLEWGPAIHDPENPFGQAATEAALDRRDAADDQRDDN
jgi:hypothetical protein